MTTPGALADPSSASASGSPNDPDSHRKITDVGSTLLAAATFAGTVLVALELIDFSERGSAPLLKAVGATLTGFGLAAATHFSFKFVADLIVRKDWRSLLTLAAVIFSIVGGYAIYTVGNTARTTSPPESPWACNSTPFADLSTAASVTIDRLSPESAQTSEGTTYQVEIAGSVSALPAEYQIWIMSHRGGRYWIVGPDQSEDAAAPAAIVEDGPYVMLDSVGTTRGTWEFMAVIADSAASSGLLETKAEWDRSRSWPGLASLPEGVAPIACRAVSI